MQVGFGGAELELDVLGKVIDHPLEGLFKVIGNHYVSPCLAGYGIAQVASVDACKTYLAMLNGTPDNRQLEQLRSGIVIDLEEKDPATGRHYTRKYKTRPARVTVVSQSAHECVLEIKISEGKNRQIRKMAEAVGLKVLQLQRTAIGEIKLGRTKEGGYRKLSAAEVDYLKNLK